MGEEEEETRPASQRCAALGAMSDAPLLLAPRPDTVPGTVPPGPAYLASLLARTVCAAYRYSHRECTAGPNPSCSIARFFLASTSAALWLSSLSASCCLASTDIHTLPGFALQLEAALWDPLPRRGSSRSRGHNRQSHAGASPRHTSREPKPRPPREHLRENNSSLAPNSRELLVCSDCHPPPVMYSGLPGL